MRYFIVVFIFLAVQQCLQSQVKPLLNAHLEDDYGQRKPLYNALEYGFRSIEIDLHLVDGELLVSNRHPSPKHDRTLEQLYLLPLREIINKNNGQIYPNFDQEFYLVIDIKTDAGLTFAALNEQLAKYEDILRIVEGNKVIPGPITIVLSGNRPIPHLWDQSKRLMAICGIPEDIGKKYPTHFMPIISSNFKEHSAWRGSGRLEERESNWLIEFCQRVHNEGKKVHFWNYPNRSIVWNKLLECGVDFVSSSKAKKLANYFNDPEVLVEDIPIAIVHSNTPKEKSSLPQKIAPIAKNSPDSEDFIVSSSTPAVETITKPKVEIPTAPTPPTILINAHAHNDYENERPLFDALNKGFTSIEVDIHLVNNELYVSHDTPEQLEETQTFENLYLKPLSNLVKKNDNSVYKHYNGPFYLMIDVKTEGELTYQLLKEQLKKYEHIFTQVNNDTVTEGAITTILSGNRPIETIASENSRMVFIDGRPGDLDRGYSSNLMPIISDNYSKHFEWDGTGKMPEREFEYLKTLVKIAQEEGKKLRFWAIPENENVWETLLKGGLGFINTDKIDALAQFLTLDN